LGSKERIGMKIRVQIIMWIGSERLFCMPVRDPKIRDQNSDDTEKEIDNY
jgi:hypothetical protein